MNTTEKLLAEIIEANLLLEKTVKENENFRKQIKNIKEYKNNTLLLELIVFVLIILNLLQYVF